MNTPPTRLSGLLLPIAPLILAFFAMLGGCQHFALPGAETKADAQTAADPKKTPKSASFSPETLYALLAAELAGQRDQYDVALANYLQQAKVTQDPGIAERAFHIAQYLEDDQAAFDSALIWAGADADNQDAQRAAALQLARAGRYQEAMQYMERVLQTKGQANFDFLALSAAKTDAKTRAGLLSSFDRLLQKYPGDSQLKFGKAVLLHQDGRDLDALRLLGNSKDPALVLLHARLLQGLERGDEALALLKRGIKANPSDKRLGLSYAQLLAGSGRLAEAKGEFARLLEQFPDDDDLLYSLALLSIQAEDWDDAQSYLEELTLRGSHLESVHYHLGALYQKQGDTANALDEYQQVPLGGHYLPAQMQRTKLLMAAGRSKEATDSLKANRLEHPELASQLYLIEAQNHIDLDQLPDAWRVLHKALGQFPDDSDLLYARAMLAEKRNNLKQLERDLRRIIAREPDNAMAINALGYTLADRTTRYSEARQLIEQAHRLAPEDPAVLDSLGWVNYRLGHLKEAEDYLRSAFQQFPDAEVASHLGEVLWVQGRQDEARDIWRQGLTKDGNQDTLLKTLERLTGSRTP